jgi:UDP-N-acetylglucosamine 4,6-dehydratase/5-epimerase
MNYLITGGTGTLGNALTDRLLANGHRVRIYSRDEFKQWEMSTRLKGKTVSFFLGDVRDRLRLIEAADGCDFIVHAAALKHVWAGEQHPAEVIQTNVNGTKNALDAASQWGAKMLLVSSDKAYQPKNLYGSTKMAAEGLTMAAGQNVVRYGNVFGSRGSVLHKFAEWVAEGHSFKITDKNATRFILTISQAVDLVIKSLLKPLGSMYIPRDLPALSIGDLAHAFDPDAVIEEIGLQQGEKLHESLDDGLSSDKARRLTIDEIKELIRETL